MDASLTELGGGNVKNVCSVSVLMLLRYDHGFDYPKYLVYSVMHFQLIRT
jgi:hypothetical protein